MGPLYGIQQGSVQQYIDEVAAGLVGQHHARLQEAGRAEFAQPRTVLPRWGILDVSMAAQHSTATVINLLTYLTHRRMLYNTYTYTYIHNYYCYFYYY